MPSRLATILKKVLKQSQPVKRGGRVVKKKTHRKGKRTGLGMFLPGTMPYMRV